MDEKIVLFDIDYTLFDTGLYKESSLTTFKIYDEIAEMLEAVSTVATIGIFSEGETDHQHKKLIETGIKKHFHDDHLHIFTKKLDSLPDVLKQYQGKEIYFVDDKLEVLKAIQEYDLSITTIWIKRGAYADAVREITGFTPDYEVDDLKSVGDILHNK